MKLAKIIICDMSPKKKVIKVIEVIWPLNESVSTEMKVKESSSGKESKER